MPFDIVEHVCELPYLVLTTLFQFLPADTAALYRECGSPEIRQLARLRRWRKVSVGTQWARPAYLDEISRYRGDLGMSVDLDLFDRMVRNGIQPPYPTQVLEVYLSSENVSRVIGWKAYVESHFSAVVMLTPSYDVDFLDTHPSVFELFSNLVSLRLCSGLTSSREIQFAGIRLPEGLRALEVGPLLTPELDCRELVLPKSLTLLAMWIAKSPLQLPQLPEGLRLLTIRGLKTVDFSPFVGILPCSLVELFVVRTTGFHGYREIRSAAILASDAEYLPPLLQVHNLDVTERDVRSSGYMIPLESAGSWRLVLDRATDFASFIPPEGVELLQIVRESDANPQNYLTHLLPRLPELKKLSILGLPVGQAKVSSVQVPNLTELVLSKIQAMSKCNGEFLANLTNVSMTDCVLRAVPRFVPQSTKLVTLDMRRCCIIFARLNGTEFPPSLKWLSLAQNRVGPQKTVKRRRPGKRTARSLQPCLDLGHITGLEYLDVLDCNITSFQELVLPSSILKLNLSKNKMSRSVLEDVKLPPSLQVLSLSESGIRSPWKLSLPASIKELSLLRNALTVMPKGYRFPSDLEVLRMENCRIKRLDVASLLRGVRLLYICKSDLASGVFNAANLPPTLEVVSSFG